MDGFHERTAGVGAEAGPELASCDDPGNRPLGAARALGNCLALCYRPSAFMLLQSVKPTVRRSLRIARALGTACRSLAGLFPGSQSYWMRRYPKVSKGVERCRTVTSKSIELLGNYARCTPA